MRRLAPLLLLFAVAGCDSLGGDAGFTPEVVVESYQLAGRPFEPVRLSRTAPVDRLYNAEEQAIRDARVAVVLLRADGTEEARFPFALSNGADGRYDAVGAGGVVLPLRRYRLEADVPGFGRVTSETVVPDTFRIVSANADSLTYQGAQQFIFRVTRSAYPGRKTFYNFTTETLLDEPAVTDATPFIRSFLDQNNDGRVDDDVDFDLEDLRISGSPLLNEANYIENADGTISIRLPWIAVVFYGPNRIAANAVDDNLYDFVRSQSVQQGGSTLSPGEIPNVLDRVENGRGLFGSYARVERRVFVAR